MGKILAIDFDGVIHDYKNFIEGKKMGGPIDGARESLRELKSRGNKLIIFTAKAENIARRIMIETWLIFFDIPFDEVTNIKLNADFFIDDKAICFENNWPEILQKLK